MYLTDLFNLMMKDTVVLGALSMVVLFVAAVVVWSHLDQKRWEREQDMYRVPDGWLPYAQRRPIDPHSPLTPQEQYEEATRRG